MASQNLPLVRTATEESIPRAIILARGLIAACNYQLTEEAFSFYLESVQEIEPLRLNELWGMLMALKLSLLELLSQRGNQAIDAFHARGQPAASFDVGTVDSQPALHRRTRLARHSGEAVSVHRIFALIPPVCICEWISRAAKPICGRSPKSRRALGYGRDRSGAPGDRS